MSTAQVNKPTDTKQKEADVNRKLQFYGIASAFQGGKVPSNDQIDVALNSFLNSKALSSPSDKLSSDGKGLVADVREVVTQAKRLLLSKNEGNLLQDFIWQTQQFDPSAVNRPGSPLKKDDAKQDGDKALQGLRTLGTLIITNGQFRKLLSDSVVLLRDMAGDAATNTAAKVKPTDEQLSGIDAPAEDNTWHDQPDFSKDNLKKQFEGVYKHDAKDVAKAGQDAAQNQGTAAAGLQASKDQASSKVTSETSDAGRKAAQEYRARARDYLGKKVPPERRERTVWRLKKMVLECQQHSDYQQAIQTLLDLAEQYGGHARHATSGGAGTVKTARTHLSEAESDLKTLIERFANGTSSDDLWDSINQVYKHADQDPELKDWFRTLNQYIRRLLQEQGYIIDESSNQDWNRIHDRGIYLLRDKYRSDTDRIVDEIKFLADQFELDPQNKAFGQAVQKLFTDLGNDENGKSVFKPHLIKDLTEIIIPATFENLAYIPVPRIEYSDPQFDAVIENLVLESDNFMPNVLEIASDNYFRWGRKKIANHNRHAVEVKVAGIQMDLRDVSYHVKRKVGFPKLTDTGVANILLAGDGFSFDMKLSSADKKDKQKFFKVDKVDVDVKNFKIKLVKSSHKLLFNAFQPIMLKTLRPAIQRALEKAIKDNVDQMDALLFQIKQEADHAKEEAKSDPQNAPNVYSRYLDATKKRFMQNKEQAKTQAKAKTEDKKVNYAITNEDSIFPNVKLPGGISSKATEYKELARKGERWESPVFSIGSAPRSSDLPTAPRVTRKTHTTGSTTNGASSNANPVIDGTVNGAGKHVPTTLDPSGVVVTST